MKTNQPCRLFTAKLLKDKSEISGIWDNGKFYIEGKVYKSKDLLNIQFLPSEL